MQLNALPGFRDFFPEELALRTHLFDAMRRVARRGERGPALRLHRQGRARGGAPSRDDAHPGPDGGAAGQWSPEADPLVLDPAALPLRAAAAGPAPGALPAQLRPNRRGG